MSHSPETMKALADVYAGVLRSLMEDAIADGFWFGADHVTSKDGRYASLDLNWGETACDSYGGGYRTIFDGEDQ